MAGKVGRQGTYAFIYVCMSVRRACTSEQETHRMIYTVDHSSTHAHAACAHARTHTHIHRCTHAPTFTHIHRKINICSKLRSFSLLCVCHGLGSRSCEELRGPRASRKGVRKHFAQDRRVKADSSRTAAGLKRSWIGFENRWKWAFG